ncbi:MAG: hypothetical protein QOD83_3428 [Solirubrobacteraceae bacterium]|nr:hypothetical protein [Solirubrobacteraceae bacterium]
MLKIDVTFLGDVGLSQLPRWEQNLMLKHVYETLERRVGIVLADRMTNEQLDQFELYFERKDDAGAFQWLESNFPDYKDIVQSEYTDLKTEVTRLAPEIMRISAADPREDPPSERAKTAADPGSD